MPADDKPIAGNRDEAKAAHTPGPWHVVQDTRINNCGEKKFNGWSETSPALFVCAAKGVPVISRRGLARPTKSDGKANARLIAAAPCLLEALKGVVAILEGPTPPASKMFSSIEAARSAIQRAEGGQ